MRRIGISGATGAIGLALIEKCIEEGVEVYVFLRKDSERAGRIPEHPLVHRVRCALDEMKDLDITGIPELDVFYHLAWMKAFGEENRNDLHTQTANIDYAIDAVELAERLSCRRFIGAGSQAEYGRKDEALKPETSCEPENGYGIAKLAAGQMTRLECEKRGLEHIWIRILSVYGPGDGEKTLVSSVIKDALEGLDPQCTKAEQMWDYLYSKDAAEALYLAGCDGVPGKTYVLGSGSARPLRSYIEDICDICADITGKRVSPEYVRPYGDKQVMYLVADVSDLKEDTGFEAKTSFEAGIRETVKFMLEEKD